MGHYSNASTSAKFEVTFTVIRDNNVKQPRLNVAKIMLNTHATAIPCSSKRTTFSDKKSVNYYHSVLQSFVVNL